MGKKPKNLETLSMERPIFSKSIESKNEAVEDMTVLDWIKLRLSADEQRTIENLSKTHRKRKFLFEAPKDFRDCIVKICNVFSKYDTPFCMSLHKTHIDCALQKNY